MHDCLSTDLPRQPGEKRRHWRHGSCGLCENVQGELHPCRALVRIHGRIVVLAVPSVLFSPLLSLEFTSISYTGEAALAAALRRRELGYLL